jgi:hypothetical protein
MLGYLTLERGAAMSLLSRNVRMVSASWHLEKKNKLLCLHGPREKIFGWVMRK